MILMNTWDGRTNLGAWEPLTLETPAIKWAKTMPTSLNYYYDWIKRPYNRVSVFVVLNLSHCKWDSHSLCSSDIWDNTFEILLCWLCYYLLLRTPLYLLFTHLGGLQNVWDPLSTFLATCFRSLAGSPRYSELFRAGHRRLTESDGRYLGYGRSTEMK